MTYNIHEIFYTLQGEGIQTGHPAVFIRFTGCNLWSGREEDRATAQCRFCDTDFTAKTRYTDAESLADAALALWPSALAQPYIVLTGGEPSLQIDEPLLNALHHRKAKVAIETNGTRRLPSGLDWICVSPKAGTSLVVTGGDELKLVFPQNGLDPQDMIHLDFRHFLLQPMDGPDQARNTRLALDYCRADPRWRLSLQTHKILDIP